MYKRVRSSNTVGERRRGFLLKVKKKCEAGEKGKKNLLEKQKAKIVGANERKSPTREAKSQNSRSKWEKKSLENLLNEQKRS